MGQRIGIVYLSLRNGHSPWELERNGARELLRANFGTALLMIGTSSRTALEMLVQASLLMGELVVL
jgi:hypothetical protein